MLVVTAPVAAAVLYIDIAFVDVAPAVVAPAAIVAALPIPSVSAVVLPVQLPTI